MKILLLVYLLNYLVSGITGIIRKQRLDGSVARMGLVKWGALVVDGRGKVGGTVMSKNRAGNYFRNKTTPVNPRTTAQVGARNRLITQSQAWRGLTAAQIAAWNAAVEDFKKTNIFGDQVRPTGFNLHNGLNATLDLVSVAAIADPPAPVAVGGITSVTLTMANGADTASIAYAPSPVPANEAYLVYMTPGVSAGKSFVNSEFRFVVFEDAAATTPLDVKADYASVFGAVPAAGLKVFVRLIPCSKVTGQRGVAIQGSAIVAA